MGTKQMKSIKECGKRDKQQSGNLVFVSQYQLVQKMPNFSDHEGLDFCLTLPNHERPPSRAPELEYDIPVTFHISIDLPNPESPVGLWNLAAMFANMPVPETAMNKNHLPPTRKNNIGLPRQVGTMQAEPIA
jgi:hypothetical protein